MKNCTHCKHAAWDKTAAGRLHPSGHGKCQYPYKVPELPQAFFWVSFSAAVVRPSGGHINRRQELKDHCAYFARMEHNDGFSREPR